MTTLLSDQDAMQRALQLAEQAYNTTTPNPRVGCVIIKDQQILGSGFTQPAGLAHAEVQALNDAKANGHDVRGATVYVTLEPCSHVGRTPPCANALIEAGVKRVVAAMVDPNPNVAGRGIAMLRAAGIEVTCPFLEDPARDMNIGFIKRMQTGKPWVRMKIAASLDGKTALYNKQSQWITGEAARANGHRWRARACAILTGIGTVLDDNPQLTVRDIPTARQPMRIVVDSRLQTPLTAQLLKADTPVLIAYAQSNPEKEASLRAAGAEVIYLPNADGKVDLPALIEELGRREINELHVEAGAKLNGALIEAACVDELLIYLAPSLIGDALPMIELPALTDLALQRRLRFHHVEQIGEDLTILARFNAPL